MTFNKMTGYFVSLGKGSVIFFSFDKNRFSYSENQLIHAECSVQGFSKLLIMNTATILKNW